jgi:hypothetical protein
MELPCLWSWDPTDRASFYDCIYLNSYLMQHAGRKITGPCVHHWQAQRPLSNSILRHRGVRGVPNLQFWRSCLLCLRYHLRNSHCQSLPCLQPSVREGCVPYLNILSGPLSSYRSAVVRRVHYWYKDRARNRGETRLVSLLPQATWRPTHLSMWVIESLGWPLLTVFHCRRPTAFLVVYLVTLLAVACVVSMEGINLGLNIWLREGSFRKPWVCEGETTTFC